MKLRLLCKSSRLTMDTRTNTYDENNSEKVQTMKDFCICTQRNELIKTTKRILLSIFLEFHAKFLVEVRKRFCCV